MHVESVVLMSKVEPTCTRL